MQQYKSLFVFLVLTGATALVGSQFLPGAWYAGLEKPFFNPPNWVFAPVWSLLYIMMAVAGWRIWRRCGVDTAIVLWAVQLVLNGLWSWVFFGLHRTGLGLIDIGVLLVLIALTTISFMRRDRVAGYLMLPYLAWVAFASILNLSLWLLN
ncbi:tryptophan-rich sensory protein [Allopusillimonas ginsengisoli]|nr:tryptophan-rich sensory protein [Allopusillimonas ginsengisoli]